MQWWRLSVPLVVFSGGALGCGDRFVPSPFVDDGEPTPDAGTAGAPGTPDAGVTEGPRPLPDEVLGGPCVDDAQCDDGIDCTFGRCDPELGLCRFVADDERCADALYCNGVERCDPRVGCTAGPPTSCSDSTPCTVDRCDETTHSCVREPRDVDGDGDVDGNCQPGGDCNDLDPSVSSTAPELCANQRDDDCDGEVDEGDCQLPEFDTCADGLAISASGSYELSPAGAVLDYGPGCSTDAPGVRELVLLLDVPEGEPRDLELVARTTSGGLTLAQPSGCGELPAADQCFPGAPLSTGGGVARLLLHSPTAGVHPIYLYAESNAPIQLEVAEQAPSSDPTNVACDTRAELEPSTPVEVDLATSLAQLESACPADRADRYFEFSLAETSDVRLSAESLDGFGEPRLSVRSDACAGLDAELRCTQRALATTQLRALSAGTYVVALSASGPTRARLSLDVSAPTPAPPSDSCASAPALTANQTEVLDFDNHEDDIAVGCSTGAIDTARRLDVAVPSDVLLVARFSPGDVGAVSLALPACNEGDSLGCTRTTEELSRVSRRGLPAGQYRVVTESLVGLPATVLAAVRPASAPTLVPGAEGCDDAVTIDERGGLYQGNTSNASQDLSASCDFATPSGAPDQLLRLVLTAPRRVLFDMRGSGFDTLLDVRRGPSCPGEELERACAVFSAGDRSFLDLDLPAGEYFVQIDGYAGASGNWFLNVFVLDP
ncbi:MAG TPA: putative metal-binding motif-containing protein [Polyangiaceae bacterium]|nr:putative metal-binding motif-containing protein [Polyangiaceae bacterium]